MPALPFRIMGLDRRDTDSNSNSNNNNNSNNSTNRYTYPAHRGGWVGNTNTSTTASTSQSNNDHSVVTTHSAPANLTPNNHHQHLHHRGSQQDPPGAASSFAAASTASSTGSGSQSGSRSQATTRPGAYQVTRTSTGPAQVYRVVVPEGVRPGHEFTVHAGSRRVRVRCPPTSRPGQSLQITLPPETTTHLLALRAAPLTAASGSGGGGAHAMHADVLRVNQQAQASGGSAQTYLVTIPPHIHPGMQFTVNVGGQKFMVSCPASAGPNMRVRIVPPVLPTTPEAAPKTQVFEVGVPQGVQPGQPFALVANGQRVLVTCPPNVVPGQKIRFQLPVAQVVGNIQLDYESEQGGWKRTIRVTDLKFQWVRVEKDGLDAGAAAPIEVNSAFDFLKSAYVRRMEFLEGNDARLRTGTVAWVKATEAVVDSKLLHDNRTLLSYADIVQAQNKPLPEKKAWFENICEQLTVPWEEGHVKLCVRRGHLLTDSLDAVMGLGRDDLRKRWRLEFLGEPAIDAGGPTKEWFELVTEHVMDPACGLWVPSVNNQACVDINPASGMCSVCVCVCWIVVVVVVHSRGHSHKQRFSVAPQRSRVRTTI